MTRTDHSPLTQALVVSSPEGRNQNEKVDISVVPNLEMVQIHHFTQI